MRVGMPGPESSFSRHPFRRLPSRSHLLEATLQGTQPTLDRDCWFPCKGA